MNSIFSERFLRKLITNFFVIVGAISGIIQIITVSYPNFHSYGWKGWVSVGIISILIAIFRVWPKTSFSEQFSNPDVKISIKIGDIFEQPGHLIIGFSDTFDTEIGDIISKDSMQGQFLQFIYENNRHKLDADIDTLLQSEKFEEDPTKTHGKSKRYRVGTTIALSKLDRKFFCCAYSHMDSNLKATSDIDKLWMSLKNLWDKIRVEGEQKTIVMPIIGTRLARVSGISFKLPMKLILLSFIINSRIEPISKELVLVIREEDKDKINLLEFHDFLKSLRT